MLTAPVFLKRLSKVLDKTTIAVENLTKELASDIAGVRDADNGGSFVSVGVCRQRPTAFGTSTTGYD